LTIRARLQKQLADDKTYKYDIRHYDSRTGVQDNSNAKGLTINRFTVAFDNYPIHRDSKQRT
jgi:hypothetical protein